VLATGAILSATQWTHSLKTRFYAHFDKVTWDNVSIVPLIQLLHGTGHDMTLQQTMYPVCQSFTVKPFYFAALKFYFCTFYSHNFEPHEQYTAITFDPTFEGKVFNDTGFSATVHNGTTTASGNLVVGKQQVLIIKIKYW